MKRLNLPSLQQFTIVQTLASEVWIEAMAI